MCFANCAKTFRADSRSCGMKLRLIIIVVLIVVLLIPAVAFADTSVEDELNQNVDDGLNNIDFSAVDELAGGFFDSVADKVRSIINGDFDSAESFWQVFTSLLGEGIKGLLPELVSIFAVLVILGLIRKTNGGLISESTDNVVSFVGATVIIASVLFLVVGVYRQVFELLNKIAALSEVSSPILLTLLVANGANVTSSVCQPSMVMYSTGIIQIVRSVVLPMSIFAMVFAAVSNISSNVRVSKASEFFNNASGWILGVLFMLFSAVTTVQGISAAAIDGVSFRAAKFATKNYIPILGGYLADGFDMIAASTSLIKNAFGVVTLLILLFSIIKPLVAVLCLNLGLQAVSAFAEPIADEKYIKIIGGMSKTLTFLAVLILAVSFMFGILTLIAICTMNGV